MDARYRAYVKNVLDLTATPQIFLTITEGNISSDILTRASASFTCLDDVPEEVREGDILVVYDYSGKVIFQGVISQKQERQLQCDQIYALFNQGWFYRVFREDHLEHEIADIFNDFIAGEIGKIVSSVPAANEENFMKNINYFRRNGNIFEEYRITRQFDDEQHKYVYSNPMIRTAAQIVSSLPTANEENYAKDTTYLVLSGEKYNKYRIKRTYNSTTRVYSYSMEQVGEIPASDVDTKAIPALTDSMMQSKYGSFVVSYDDSQEVHITFEDGSEDSTRNLEDFIYKIYEDYGVVTEIEIPFEGAPTLHFKTANYTGTKIAKNSTNIISITPTTETEETNKLIIMSSAGAYRETYYATTNGIVVESDNTNRLPVINTSFVYSDDPLEDIKAANLKDEMYNHQLVFSMFIRNNIYDFYSWKLGTPFEVYYKGVYYKTIYTGFSYSFSEGGITSTVDITCGKVRTRLTDLLNMKKA